MERIVCTAIIEKTANGFAITFPGDALTDVEEETFDEALRSAREVITLAVMDAEEAGLPFECAVPDMEHLEEGQQLISIDVWMPYERSKVKETYTKKTLTIPTWLNLLAQQKNVNFSKVLTDGLKDVLHIA